MATSALLGTKHTIDLPSGRLAYYERGSGKPVVFVHGVLVNADLWRNVVPAVATAGYRSIAIDLPLGSHDIPMPPAADLSPLGVAHLIAEFLDALDLDDVTIVANDTGGALTQLLMTNHPERIGKVVLTPCDALDYFFPPMFKPFQIAVAIPGMTWLLSKAMKIPAVRRSQAVYGILTKHPIPDDILASYTASSGRSSAIRRDLRRFVRGVDKRYTLTAAEQLGDFKQPVLLIGAEVDKVFPDRLADHLVKVLPDARKITIADSYTFVPEDQPAELARLVVDFISPR